MTLDQLIEAHREEILRIAAPHGAYNVRIFGSTARGNAGPESPGLISMVVAMSEVRKGGRIA